MPQENRLFHKLSFNKFLPARGSATMGFFSSSAVASKVGSEGTQGTIAGIAGVKMPQIPNAEPLTMPQPSLQQQLSSISEAESMIDLSSLDLLDRSGSPSPMVAESDVSSVSTRNSNVSYSARDSFYEDGAFTVSSSTTEAIDDRGKDVTCTSLPVLPPGPSRRKPLQWEFTGLTLWIELEEFNNDLSNIIRDVSESHGTEIIPQSHMTAIYGMEHLSSEEACRRLREDVPKLIARWPKFRRPIGIVQDIAIAGNPGQVCSIAWAQLTLSSGPDHEIALDALYDVFYGAQSKEKADRHRPWTPHNSFAYDNPEDSVLNTADAFAAVAKYPTLLSKERDVAAISLWDTNGKMRNWKCLERLRF